MGDQERLPSGFLKDIADLQLPPQVTFAGHVRLVQGIVLPTYVGCHAVVVLSDPPGKAISVVTSEQRLQGLLEAAVANVRSDQVSGRSESEGLSTWRNCLW